MQNSDERVAVIQGRAAAQLAFALEALRGIVLLNGGAIIAALTLIGQAWGKDAEQGRAMLQAFAPGLLLFAFGTVCGELPLGRQVLWGCGCLVYPAVFLTLLALLWFALRDLV